MARMSGEREEMPDSALKIIMALMEAAEEGRESLGYTELAKRLKGTVRSPRTLNIQLKRLADQGLIKRKVDTKSKPWPPRTSYFLTFDVLKQPERARRFLFAQSASHSFYYGQMKQSLLKPKDQAAWKLSLTSTNPESFLADLARKVGSFVLFMYLKDLEDFMSKIGTAAERGSPVADFSKLKKATAGMKPGELREIDKGVQVTEWPDALTQYLTNPETAEFDLTWSPLSEGTKAMLRDFNENFIATRGVHALANYLMVNGTRLQDLLEAFDSRFAKEDKVLSEAWKDPAQIVDFETGTKAYRSLLPGGKKGEALWRAYKETRTDE
jgi:hypothetical protein